MLRITSVLNGDRSLVNLRLEGDVIAHWVPALEQEIAQWLQMGRRVVLDFSDVRRVDGRGAAMLKSMAGADVEIVNCPPLIRDSLL